MILIIPTPGEVLIAVTAPGGVPMVLRKEMSPARMVALARRLLDAALETPPEPPAPAPDAEATAG